MALLLTAVEGLTLVDDNPVNTTTTTITSVPSTKVKAEGKGVIKKELGFTINVGSGIAGSCVLIAPLTGQIIDPTATKVKAEGELVMREQDSKTINATGQTTPSPPPPAPCPLVFMMRISDAGQTKAKAQ